MPGGRGNIRPEDRTQGFDVNPQNAGRPKKLVSYINEQLKKEGYTVVTKSHILTAYQTLINLPLTKIAEIARKEDDNYPILYKLVAKELLGKRGGEYLDKLLDRIIGKPKQEHELTGNMTMTDIDLSDLTSTELKFLEKIGMKQKPMKRK
jgi:hypothetical protein